MVEGKRAPRLPKQQLTILAICRFAEPVAMTSVYPYIVSNYRPVEDRALTTVA